MAIDNLLKNPDMIDKEFIPEENGERGLTEQERNKLLRQLKRRLNSVEIFV